MPGWPLKSRPGEIKQFIAIDSLVCSENCTVLPVTLSRILTVNATTDILCITPKSSSVGSFTVASSFGFSVEQEHIQHSFKLAVWPDLVLSVHWQPHACARLYLVLSLIWNIFIIIITSKSNMTKNKCISFIDNFWQNNQILLKFLHHEYYLRCVHHVSTQHPSLYQTILSDSFSSLFAWWQN